jgi:hypothetical protein
MAIYEFFTSRNNGANAASFIGQAGRLFYDGTNGVVKLSDGVTPGGTAIPYTVATATVIGGIKAGAGANVATDGTLTIDTSGLPLSIGNLQIEDTTIKTLNVDEDLFLVSNGVGNVNLIGTVNFYKPNGFPPTEEPYFRAKNDGQIRILVPAEDPIEGGVEIIGSDTGTYIPPGAPGTMLQITGNPGLPARLYLDGNAEYASFVARRYNGNVAVPTQVLANQDVLRINATAATTSGVGNVALGQIRISALEDQTPTAQGSSITFTVTPVGSSAANRVDVANVTVAEGITVTKARVLGNLTVSGNIVGNATTTTATIGELRVSGNVTFNANVNNAVTNGFNKAGGTAVANGRTGQITSLADIIAKGSAATFTITNSYITNKDVVIVNIASGASIDAYSVSVTAVNNGNCQVTVTNNGSGSLSQALVFNFAVIKVV